MSSHIWYIGEYSIAAGKTETFKALIEQVIELERSDGPDVLNYEFYFNDDETKFYAIELFRDSEAVLDHLQRTGDTIPKILEVADLTRFEIYGDATKSLKDAMVPFGATMFGHWAGFTRLASSPAT